MRVVVSLGNASSVAMDASVSQLEAVQVIVTMAWAIESLVLPETRD